VIEAKEAFDFRTAAIVGSESVSADGQWCFRRTAMPVDLPTFDEVVGPTVAARTSTPSFLIASPRQLNVYTLHAEVEGI
jgi:undecaprenyl phosphate-alpha-L-ara4FN deformylase